MKLKSINILKEAIKLNVLLPLEESPCLSRRVNTANAILGQLEAAGKQGLDAEQIGARIKLGTSTVKEYCRDLLELGLLSRSATVRGEAIIYFFLRPALAGGLPRPEALDDDLAGDGSGMGSGMGSGDGSGGAASLRLTNPSLVKALEDRGDRGDLPLEAALGVDGFISSVTEGSEGNSDGDSSGSNSSNGNFSGKPSLLDAAKEDDLLAKDEALAKRLGL
jgi:hypothetical protein